MPTYGIEPQIRIYKIRVIPFNYAGLNIVNNARGNRTLIPCVKGKCINRYTIASLCEEWNWTIDTSSWDWYVTFTLPRVYFLFSFLFSFPMWKIKENLDKMNPKTDLQASGLEPEHLMISRLKWDLSTSFSMLALCCIDSNLSPFSVFSFYLSFFSPRNQKREQGNQK